MSLDLDLDITAVLQQSPEHVTRETAAEALSVSAGNVANAIALMWDRAAPQKDPSLDPVQAKWASVRDIADSISNAHDDYLKRNNEST